MKILEVFDKGRSDQVVTPYIIAEAGVNHEGSMETAKRLIDEAKQGGAHAIKFQTYKAEKLASKNSPAYWDTTKESTQSQYELFKKYDKFWKSEFESLALHCETVGIEFLSTPFDVESAKFLNALMPVFKISSSDLNNKMFIDHICSYEKPVILSTGASYLEEIKESVRWIESKGVSVSLLHCVLNYPTADENANLARISGLKKAFPEHIIGYSDHTLPRDMKVMEMATLLGSQIIEKHFTHDKSLPGNDHYHAMDKEDLKVFWRNFKRTESILGSSEVTTKDGESSARENARRSLVAAKTIEEGREVSLSDLTFKRPGHGISPKDYETLVGKKAKHNISEDEILTWEMFQ